MIRSIEIKNFKCFDNLRLPLSKLTMSLQDIPYGLTGRGK